MTRPSRHGIYTRFRQPLSKLRNLFGFKRSTTSRCRPSSSSSFLQASYRLEARQLLAGIYVDSGSQEVLIGGTSGNDVASVEYSGNSVVFKLSGFESETVPKSQVKKVFFVGTDGNDRFENKTSIPSFAYGNAGNDTLIGGSGNDQLGGGDGRDLLVGKDGDDVLVGGNGDDRVEAGDGGDTVYGIAGSNVINSGNGKDLVFGGTGRDTINGGAGDDELYSNGGHDLVKGGDGDDILGGHTGNDTLIGGNGNDRLYGGEGNDQLSDVTGTNLLAGGKGHDEATGGSGKDTIYGGDGADVIRGGGGDDVLAGQAGSDKIYGGNGDDKLLGNDGADEIFGQAGSDLLLGLAGDDFLSGGTGNDTLYGGANRDSLYGGNGNDKLFGEAGLDGLFGGIGGRDSLSGGPGADRFLLHNEDIRQDFRSTSDVELRFEDSTSNWTNKEIEVLDRGFSQLHHRTAGVRVLRNTLDTDELTFFKVRTASSGNAAQNQLSMSYRRDGLTGILIPGSQEYTRKISFADWDESDADQNEFRTRAAIHEIAHNWDSQTEINSVLRGQGFQFANFVKQSLWRSAAPNINGYVKASGTTFEPFEIEFDPATKSYRQSPKSWWYYGTASFARDYGSTSPLEDWATMWEAAFAATPDPAISQKLAIVNRFLATV